jgi:hypothetical protein
MDSELRRIQKEVETLKKQKERKLEYSQSLQERNRLLNEIKQLDQIGKSPSALKSFGNTFFKGAKIIGGKLWKATKKASKNLERSSPEFQQMSKRKQSYKQPYSDLGMMYLPSPIEEPIQLVKVKVKQPKLKRLRQTKLKKGKKQKYKRTQRRPKVYMRSGVQNPNSWELP